MVCAPMPRCGMSTQLLTHKSGALAAYKRTSVRQARCHASAPAVEVASGVSAALEALRSGRPVAILDAADREGETDIFFAGIGLQPPDMRYLRREAGGEMYVAIGNKVAQHFDLPYVGDVFKACKDYRVLEGMDKYTGDMCQGRCSVGLSFDHRETHTGAPDNERSFTVRRFAELYVESTGSGASIEDARAALGREFHIPGHIFFCIENERGVAARTGHSDLSIALAKLAGVVPVMVGCVMLENEGESFGALSPTAAEAWCAQNGVPFVTGSMVVEAVNQANGALA